MNKIRSKAIKTRIFYDPYLVWSVGILLAIGLVMLASASMVISNRQFNYPFFYLIRQTVSIFLGLVIILITVKIPIHIWDRLSGYLMLLTLLLLLLVLIPFIGHMVNGSRRWIVLGPISMQISEFAKGGIVIYLARYMSRYQVPMRETWSGFLKPIILLAMLSGLLILEPDFGSAVIVLLLGLSLLFICGVRWWLFVLLFVAVSSALWLLSITAPYRLDRITSFLNPWETPFGTGYQLTQSLIAFGRGGLFGVGLGNGVQKLFYLPEAHTDFVFAVLGEELGFLGEIGVIFLFVFFIARIFFIGRQSEKKNTFFSAYLAYGIAIWLSLQTIINIGVSVGLLPTKGITLPFMSYGGSSILICCFFIGIIFRVAYENEVSPQNSLALRPVRRKYQKGYQS